MVHSIFKFHRLGLTNYLIFLSLKIIFYHKINIDPDDNIVTLQTKLGSQEVAVAVRTKRLRWYGHRLQLDKQRLFISKEV